MPCWKVFLKVIFTHWHMAQPFILLHKFHPKSKIFKSRGTTSALPHNAWFEVRLGYPTMLDYFTKIVTLSGSSLDLRIFLRNLEKLILFEMYRGATSELLHNARFFHPKVLHCEVAQQILESFSGFWRSKFYLKCTEGPPLNYPTMLDLKSG